jgi:hypothetical protein
LTLKLIWIEKRETSNRVRGRIETIIVKNVEIDDHEFRNPVDLTKQLRAKLPKRVIEHHLALLYAEAPQFMRNLVAAEGSAAAVARTDEIVGAPWGRDRSNRRTFAAVHIWPC